MYEAIYDIDDPIFPTSASREFESLEKAISFKGGVSEDD